MSDASRVSYVHPYGFTVIRLPETQFSGWEIRAHLWPSRNHGIELRERIGSTGQEVHAHGWDIISKVVLGSIEERRYALGPADGYLYSVTSDHGAGASALELSSAHVGASCTETVVRGASDGLYYIDAGKFHSSETTDAPSVSLVATSRAPGASSFVWSRKKLTRETNERLPVMSLEEQLEDYSHQYNSTHATEDRWASFVFLQNSQNEVLLVRPARHPTIWQPIGGRSDTRDRSQLATVIRETLEESGVELTESQLTEVWSGVRDIGRGPVGFWRASIGDSALSLQYGEILEAKWFKLDDALSQDVYDATRAALEAMRKP